MRNGHRLWYAVRISVVMAVIVLCYTHIQRIPVMAYAAVSSPAHASSSWISDGSVYSGSGIDSQDSSSDMEEGTGEKGWLAKAVAELFISIADGLLALLNKMYLTMDLMIFGRVRGVARAAGVTVNCIVTAPYTFELTYGNIYGATAGAMYGMLRSMCIGFLTIYLVYKLAKATFTGTGKQLAEIKDGLWMFVLSALLAFIMPNIVDVMLYIRDVILYQQTYFLESVGGTPSVTANMWAAYNARPTIVNAMMCLGACLLTIYFGASYVGLAVGMTILFAAFPITAVVAQYDRRLLTSWFKEILGSALTPCFDCLLLTIPCLMGKYLPSLYVVQFITCFMIIPARQILKSAVGITSVTANTMGMAAFGGVMAGLNVARAVTRTAGMAAFGVGRYAARKIGGAVSDAKMAKTEGALAKAESDERSAAIREADGTAVREEIAKLDSQAAKSESISGSMRATGIKGTPGEAAAYDNLAQTAQREAASYRELAGGASAKANALRGNIRSDMPENEKQEIMANAASFDETASAYMLKADSSMRQADGYKKKAGNSRTIMAEDSRAAELRNEIRNIKADAKNRQIAGVQRLAAVNGTSVDEEDASLNAMESARIDDLTRNGERINSQISGLDVDIADKDVALNKARDEFKHNKASANSSRQKLSEARRAYNDFMQNGGGSDSNKALLEQNVSEAEKSYNASSARMTESEEKVDRIESERSGLKAQRARLMKERSDNNTALANAKENQAVYNAAHDAGIGRDGNINNVYGSSSGAGRGAAYSAAGASAGYGAPGHPMSEYEAKVMEIKRKAVNYKNFDKLGELEGVQLSHEEKARYYRKRAIMRTAQGLGGVIGGTAGMTAGMAAGGVVGLGMETFTLGHTGGAFAGLGTGTGGMIGTIAGTAAGSTIGTVGVHEVYGGVRLVNSINDNFMSPPPVKKAAAAANIRSVQTEQTVQVVSNTNVQIKQGRVTTTEAMPDNIQGVSGGREQHISAPPATVTVEQQYNIERMQKVGDTVMRTQAIVSSLQGVTEHDIQKLNAKTMDTHNIAVELVMNKNSGGGEAMQLDRIAVDSAVRQAFEKNPALSKQLDELRK